MAKPEWGSKRTCGSCGARFYDMRRQPIICPKCEAVYEEEAPTRTRRARPAPVEKKPKAAPVPDESLESVDETELDDTDLGDHDDTSDDERDDMIEDASDLGEDDEDMAEVIDHLDNEGDDE
ncbi:TIGR02300 family protein [Roseospira marina]|uniref:TIGR02300 family protein n=1 Tax=Roseospira marina TaxID=140057 RepID=A0A5M6I9E3_9PROT|nr:TIGR02300 family protein [Roseospira marina]KAA5604904.1 TIGR02300 family protein [Roseospira marina]MBB4315243.1 uncharacterized protein (TIGR02300 family) [Roseospira marina]MBB5088243.1 uncharacterized protein (TIGR02300 family) [Roseospira marina]